MVRRLSPILVFLVTAALYYHGALEFVENQIADLRFKTIERAATGRIVLVEIDERSLRELDVWPWPRRYHARVVERLLAAGANTVAIDLDLSSRSDPEDDRIFAEVAAKAGSRLALSAFRQVQRGPMGELVTFRTQPLPAFRGTGRLAVVNFYPESDGRIRRATVYEPWGMDTLPTMPTVLSGRSAPAREPFLIDYSIRPVSIPRISFADVLSDRFDQSRVTGKVIVIGASAASLGDIVAVPVYAAVPGAVLQVLAAESIGQARALRRPGAIIVLLGALVMALVLGWTFSASSWRKGAATAASAGGALASLSFGVQALFPISLDLAPWLATIALSYVAALISRIDDQSLKLLLGRLALKRTDTFIRRIFDNTFDGIFTVDGAGTVRSFNAAAERIFGLPAKEVVGRTFDALLESVAGVSPTDVAPNSAVLDVGTHEARGRHVSGSASYLELAVTEMEHEDGRHLVVLARDVTEIKRHEREMSRLAQKYAQVAAGVEATTTGVVLTDPNLPDSPVVFVNPAFTAMTGYGGEEVLGKAFAVMKGEETDLKSLKALEDAISQECSISVELLHHRKDGATFWSQVQLSPVWDDDGKPLFYVWILNDISEKKQYEKDLIAARDEAVSANRMKSEFLAAMSHELRTPLNAIIGFSEMIESEIFGPLGDAKYRDYAHDIHGSASHLHAVIMDILDMAKIESGKFELIEEEISGTDEIAACLRIVTPRAAGAKLDLAADLSEPIPMFRADPRVFKQIVLNLLSNAIKFTPAGGRVSVVAGVRRDGGICVSVADTGIGMTDGDIKVALEPFAQVDGELSRKYEGTGLGLPLARNFIELHGGTLDITSEVGKGTVVTFSIPHARILADTPPGNVDAAKANVR